MLKILYGFQENHTIQSVVEDKECNRGVWKRRQVTPLDLIKYEKVFANKQIDGSKEGEKSKTAASAFYALGPLTQTAYKRLVQMLGTVMGFLNVFFMK